MTGPVAGDTTKTNRRLGALRPWPAVLVAAAFSPAVMKQRSPLPPAFDEHDYPNSGPSVRHGEVEVLYECATWTYFPDG